MNKSLKNKLKVTQLLDPDAYSADGNSTSIDASLGESLMFLVAVGAFTFTGTNYVDIKVQHCDDNATWVDAVAADIHDSEDGANGIAVAVDDASQADSVIPVHYRGDKRYVRLQLDETGTVTSFLGVVAIQGDLKASV